MTNVNDMSDSQKAAWMKTYALARRDSASREDATSLANKKAGVELPVPTVNADARVAALLLILIASGVPDPIGPEDNTCNN